MGGPLGVPSKSRASNHVVGVVLGVPEPTPLEEDFDSDTPEVRGHFPNEDKMGWPAACALIVFFISVASCCHSCFSNH